MENLANAQNLVNPQAGFYYLIKTVVQNYSGEVTEMVTMFGKDVWWEEACIGIREGLIHQDNAECCDIYVYIVKNNTHRLFTKFQRHYLTDRRKEYLQKLLKNAS